MAKSTHPQDQVIIQLLQSNGMIKSEAKTLLKSEVYNLTKEEVVKVQNYSTHFGLDAKDKLIAEILDIRRDALLKKFAA